MKRYDVLTQGRYGGGEYYLPCQHSADSPEEAAHRRVTALANPLDYAGVAVVEYDGDGQAHRIHLFDIEPYIPEPMPKFNLVPR